MARLMASPNWPVASGALVGCVARGPSVALGHSARTESALPAAPMGGILATASLPDLEGAGVAVAGPLEDRHVELVGPLRGHQRRQLVGEVHVGPAHHAVGIGQGVV